MINVPFDRATSIVIIVLNPSIYMGPSLILSIASLNQNHIGI